MIQQRDSNKKGLLQFEISSNQSFQTSQQNNPYKYSNQWEYVFSIIGVTVGFGSFWRFPYLIYKNGGGVFLIPYILAMIFIGIPLLYLETAVGQIHRISLPFIMQKIHPALKMVGIAILLPTIHFCSVYNILLTYSYRFLFTAFNPNIPFADEDITSSKYFKEQILRQSESINDFEAINPDLFLLYIFSLLVCHYIVKNGAKTTGKIVIYTASLPFVIIILLMIRALFLEGAIQGVKYLFQPKWDKLWTSEIWIDATVQVFYQFSIGIGAIVNLASMKARKQKLMRSIILVPISIILCGLLSALTIFMYLANFCGQVGLTIDNPSINLSGPQLTFNVFPKALTLLPFSNVLLLLFFVTMIMLGIDSEFGMLEALYCYLKDQYKAQPFEVFGIKINLQASKYILLLIISIGCPTLTSHAGIYYLEFYDYFLSNIPFTLGAFTELYIFVHLFKFDELQTQIQKYTEEKTPDIIRICLQSNWLLGILGCNLIFATYNQLSLVFKYSFDLYLLGWAFTLYPIALAYLYFRKHWTKKEDLCLTFFSMDHRPSYL